MKKGLLILIISLLGATCLYFAVTVNYYNVNNAVEYLSKHAEERSVGKCAQYVRLAIREGGCPTYFHPESACDYIQFLPKLGFEEIATENYNPQMGDVIVFPSIKGHEHGHIAMYDGKHWISDFKQIDKFGSNTYRQNNEHYIFRRSTGWGIRKYECNDR